MGTHTKLQLINKSASVDSNFEELSLNFIVCSRQRFNIKSNKYSHRLILTCKGGYFTSRVQWLSYMNIFTSFDSRNSLFYPKTTLTYFGLALI